MRFWIIGLMLLSGCMRQPYILNDRMEHRIKINDRRCGYPYTEGHSISFYIDNVWWELSHFCLKPNGRVK